MRNLYLHNFYLVFKLIQSSKRIFVDGLTGGVRWNNYPTREGICALPKNKGDGRTASFNFVFTVRNYTMFECECINSGIARSEISFVKRDGFDVVTAMHSCRYTLTCPLSFWSLSSKMFTPSLFFVSVKTRSGKRCFSVLGSCWRHMYYGNKQLMKFQLESRYPHIRSGTT